MRVETLSDKLRGTAAVRRNATADEKDRFLMVVARLSRDDAKLMDDAADRIDELEARCLEREARLETEEGKSAFWKARAEKAEAGLADKDEELAAAKCLLDTALSEEGSE